MRTPKVLMFGWEFPPFYSGGLGTACFGLTRSLSRMGAEIIFVIPHCTEDFKSDFVKLIGASNVKVGLKKIDSILTPYISEDEYTEKYLEMENKGGKGFTYGKNLYEEVARYAAKAKDIAENVDCDIIHAHDWLTALAGVEAKKVTGAPLVLHIHATEFDRTGGNPNQYVYDIERHGMHSADKIIAVSNFTKKKIIQHYGVDPKKIHIVHNAVDLDKPKFSRSHRLRDNDKIVLFLGRITIQKGPDYFLWAAKMVLDLMPDVKFVMAGSGDMHPFIIEKASEMGIADKFLFTGFLQGDDVHRAYSMADLYVMPSVSEPFGITPLESMQNGTPVLISKQSGVSEVLTNCLKVDFWDVHDIANKIVAALKYSPLHEELVESGTHEVNRFTWDDPAKKCLDVYYQALQERGGALW